jgi:hypothetical protein
MMSFSHKKGFYIRNVNLLTLIFNDWRNRIVLEESPPPKGIIMPLENNVSSFIKMFFTLTIPPSFQISFQETMRILY